MGSGWDTSGAISSVGRHSGGAGGYYGQVNAPRDGGPVPGIERTFDTLSKGIDSYAQNTLAREKMAMNKDKFAQDMMIQQEKLEMARQQNELQATKYAAAQKQQEFDNQQKLEDSERKNLKSQIELANFKDKQSLSELMRNNIGTMTKILDEGTYDDLVGSEEFQTTLSALSAVDPEAGFKQINNIIKKKAELDQNRKAIGTYNLTEALYLEELPKALEALDSGKGIQEAVEPIRLKIAEFYKSGNVDHKAMTTQLKSVLQVLNTYKKKSGSTPLVSFDDKGNQVDPLSGADVRKQVNPLTGKISYPGGANKKKSLVEELQELRDMQKKGK